MADFPGVEKRETRGIRREKVNRLGAAFIPVIGSFDSGSRKSGANLRSG
jgi:hypothetical protein